MKAKNINYTADNATDAEVTDFTGLISMFKNHLTIDRCLLVLLIYVHVFPFNFSERQKRDPASLSDRVLTLENNQTWSKDWSNKMDNKIENFRKEVSNKFDQLFLALSNKKNG